MMNGDRPILNIGLGPILRFV